MKRSLNEKIHITNLIKKAKIVLKFSDEARKITVINNDEVTAHLLTLSFKW